MDLKRKPYALTPGDTVAVVAPSGVVQKESLTRTKAVAIAPDMAQISALSPRVSARTAAASVS